MGSVNHAQNTKEQLTTIQGARKKIVITILKFSPLTAPAQNAQFAPFQTQVIQDFASPIKTQSTGLHLNA